MNQPAAIYSTNQVIFDRELSDTQNLILFQGFSALEATCFRIDYLYKLCGPKEGNKLFTGRDIPTLLQDLCAQAGIASQILFNDNPNKYRNESKIAYELRHERVEYVNRFCVDQQFRPEILTDREIRNSLTHIDERLPDILTQEDGIGWFIDYAASIRSAFPKPEGINEFKYCRSYVHNESKILHLDHELNLDILAKECLIVLKIVFGVDLNQ